MSTSSELSRLITAKADIKASVAAKGVDIPDTAKLDEYSDYVDAIVAGESVYDGEYTVTPSVLTTSQVLQTANKVMGDNVTVYTIPTSETLNDAGGYTFTIGG